MRVIAAFGTYGGWPFLTAIGTVGAVIVAVGLQGALWQREKQRRPAITLSFDEHKIAEETFGDNKVAQFLRLAVSNAAGKETARDVEILVLDIEEFALGAAGSGGRKIWLANPALGWTHAFDERMQYQLPERRIPPGATRYVDVGRWIQLADAPGDLNFVLSVLPEPNSRRHVLPSGGWRIRLAATMQNGDATFWDARIQYGIEFDAGFATLVDPAATVIKVKSASSAP